MKKYLLAVLIIVFILFLMSRLRFDAPSQYKICTCSNISNKASFKCPKGHLFRFAFGINYLPSFTGTLTVYKKGIEIHKIEFDPNQMEYANWLDREGYNAYVLNPAANSFETLDYYLKAN